MVSPLNKTEVVKTVLQQAVSWISPTEIIDRVSPNISRSMVYAVIKQMKEDGEIVENKRES